MPSTPWLPSTSNIPFNFYQMRNQGAPTNGPACSLFRPERLIFPRFAVRIRSCPREQNQAAPWLGPADRQHSRIRRTHRSKFHENSNLWPWPGSAAIDAESRLTSSTAVAAGDSMPGELLVQSAEAAVATSTLVLGCLFSMLGAHPKAPRAAPRDYSIGDTGVAVGSNSLHQMRILLPSTPDAAVFSNMESEGSQDDNGGADSSGRDGVQLPCNPAAAGSRSVAGDVNGHRESSSDQESGGRAGTRFSSIDVHRSTRSSHGRLHGYGRGNPETLEHSSDLRTKCDSGAGGCVSTPPCSSGGGGGRSDIAGGCHLSRYSGEGGGGAVEGGKVGGSRGQSREYGRCKGPCGDGNDIGGNGYGAISGGCDSQDGYDSGCHNIGDKGQRSGHGSSGQEVSSGSNDKCDSGIGCGSGDGGDGRGGSRWRGFGDGGSDDSRDPAVWGFPWALGVGLAAAVVSVVSMARQAWLMHAKLRGFVHPDLCLFDLHPPCLSEDLEQLPGLSSVRDSSRWKHQLQPKRQQGCTQQVQAQEWQGDGYEQQQQLGEPLQQALPQQQEKGPDRNTQQAERQGTREATLMNLAEQSQDVECTTGDAGACPQDSATVAVHEGRHRVCCCGANRSCASGRSYAVGMGMSLAAVPAAVGTAAGVGLSSASWTVFPYYGFDCQDGVTTAGRHGRRVPNLDSPALHGVLLLQHQQYAHPPEGAHWGSLSGFLLTGSGALYPCNGHQSQSRVPTQRRLQPRPHCHVVPSLPGSGSVSGIGIGIGIGSTSSNGVTIGGCDLKSETAMGQIRFVRWGHACIDLDVYGSEPENEALSLRSSYMSTPSQSGAISIDRDAAAAPQQRPSRAHMLMPASCSSSSSASSAMSSCNWHQVAPPAAEPMALRQLASPMDMPSTPKRRTVMGTAALAPIAVTATSRPLRAATAVHGDIANSGGGGGYGHADGIGGARSISLNDEIAALGLVRNGLEGAQRRADMWLAVGRPAGLSVGTAAGAVSPA